MHIGTVMAGLSRAFDSMPHKLLICKLHAYGVSPDSCQMIASYLTNRQQRVKLGEHRSKWNTLSKGFPQGSGLGPLLYNIFSNDLFYFMSLCELFNYADDNTISCTAISRDEVIDKLENDTKIVIDWFEHNLMKANPDKFTVMFLTPKRAADDFPDFLFVNDYSIARHNVTKLLGVSLDDKLQFHKHVDDICMKASRQVNALIRVRRYLDVKDRYRIYESFILSNFNFCPLVWHICGMSATKKIDKIQKRALRFVFDDFTSDYRTLLAKAHTNTLFISRLKYIAVEVYKCVNDINVSFMNDVFDVKPNIHGLRRKKNVIQPKFNTISYGKFSFKYIGSHIWNMLPDYFQDAVNVNSFKSLLKSWAGPTCNCNICHVMLDAI